MAKKRKVMSIRHSRKLVRKYQYLHRHYQNKFYERMTLLECVQIHLCIQKVPRNRIATRLRNRCQISGRSRSYYRHFGLARHFLRELSHQGFLPGIQKSSWWVEIFVEKGRVHLWLDKNLYNHNIELWLFAL